jgi:hypothetical protein
MAYRNEAHFVRALLPILNANSSVVQRIESGTTGRGIPDIYCRFKRTEVWIEAKNSHRYSIYDTQFMVKWRPGQQAWHLRYYKECKRPVLTIQAMADGFILVPLRKHYKGNMVPFSDCFVCTSLKDIWSMIVGFI